MYWCALKTTTLTTIQHTVLQQQQAKKLNGGQNRHKMVRIASVPSSVMGSNLGGAGKGNNKRVKVVSESELELSESGPPLMPFNTKPCITIYDANQAQHFRYHSYIT